MIAGDEQRKIERGAAQNHQLDETTTSHASQGCERGPTTSPPIQASSELVSTTPRKERAKKRSRVIMKSVTEPAGCREQREREQHIRLVRSHRIPGRAAPPVRMTGRTGSKPNRIASGEANAGRRTMTEERASRSNNLPCRSSKQARAKRRECMQCYGTSVTSNSDLRVCREWRVDGAQQK